MARKKPLVLTATWLDQQGACEEQVNLAILHFGRRATVTRVMLLECADLGLDLDWLAKRLLSGLALAQYERVRAQALADALSLPPLEDF